MNISKWSAVWSFLTGGWAGLAEYILEVINEWLAKLDATKLARMAEVVKAIANALEILATTFLPVRYVAPAKTTLAALNKLSLAIADGKISQKELDANIDAVKAAIEAWKEVK